MKKFWIISLLLALGLVSGLAYPALAGGLTITGGKVDAQVSPGQNYSYTMKVQNNSEESLDMAAESKGYGTSLESPFSVLEAEADKSDFSAREFLAISPANFHLEPGESQDVTVRANIPFGIGDGGRYAIVYIHTVPKGGTVATISGMAARVLLTIQGSKLTHSSKISSVDIKSDTSLQALVTLTNAGNHHYKPRLQGKLLQGDKTVATALTQDDWPVIPDYGRQLTLNFIANESLAPDEYTALIEAHDESDTVVAQYTAPVKISAPYTPPPPKSSSPPASKVMVFPPASVSLCPSTAAVLKTESDRISINIPQGAVIGPTQLSLESYSPEPIPPVSGIKLAATCFKVEGLNGLLAKEATLTVKYSAADLEKANGDASRLALARWDAASNNWAVLDTQIDKTKLTLTVNTVQFSTWAVVVNPTPSKNWLLLGCIILAVILIIYVGLLLVTKRHSQ